MLNYFSLVIKKRIEGKVKREDIKARHIIMAVRIPKVEKSGIGASPIITNPKTLEIAEPSKASPVPFID